MIRHGILETSRIRATYPYLDVINDGNTVMWFQSSDETTITKDGSNLVSRWNDKLGSGRDLVQATGSSQPTWSASGVTFNQKRMTAALGFSLPAYPLTVYWVHKLNAWDKGKYFFSFGPSAVVPFMVSHTSTPRIAVGDVDTCYEDSLAIGNYGMITYGGSYTSPDEVFIGVNNETPDTAVWPGVDTTTNTTFVMGAHPSAALSYGANFTIKEVIIRKKYDTEADRTIMWNYLKALYSL